MSQEVIKISNLFKKYNKQDDYAVKDISFSCNEGDIIGILGHNGAGKSTTLKCLMGMFSFQEGDITICGSSIKTQPLEAKQCFGFVTDNHSVFLKMTGIQYLAFMADVYGVPTDVRKARIEELEQRFQLGKSIDCLISSYSHGMKQKICMMGSLIHKPKVWILDEPMVGLDPKTTRSVCEFMKQYANEGNVILFSSHNLDMVAKLCQRAIIIKKGELFADIVIQQFLKENPLIDLEEYFLNETAQ